MPFVKVTRLVERKSKDGDRGDLTEVGYVRSGSLWIASDHVQAIATGVGYLETEDGRVDEQEITQLLLAGREEPLHVVEGVEELMEKLLPKA